MIDDAEEARLNLASCLGAYREWEHVLLTSRDRPRRCRARNALEILVPLLAEALTDFKLFYPDGDAHARPADVAAAEPAAS